MSSSDLSTIREEKSYADATVAFLIASALVVVLESVITACFIQAALSRWGYDTFRSRGLLVVGASCMVSFLSLWLCLSVISVRIAGRSLNQKLLRHSSLFLPFSLLAFYPCLPEYNRQNIAFLYFVTAVGLSGVLALFLLRESWLQCEERALKRFFRPFTLAFLICPLAVVFASLKIHEHYFLKVLASKIDHVAFKLEHKSPDRIVLPVRIAKVPGSFVKTATAPTDGVFQCAVFLNDAFAKIHGYVPVRYRVEMKQQNGENHVLAAGDLSAGAVSWVRHSLSLLAGQPVTFKFEMNEPLSISALAGCLHTLLRPSLWAPEIKTSAKTAIMSAYWSEPVLYEPRKKEEANILLIIVDALRADHLGCYGYNLNTSPTIDELARNGILFEEAISQGSWTLPAIASIYTGRLPSSHLAGYKPSLSYEPAKLPAQPNFVSLLRENGFYTIGFVTNPFLTPDFGMVQGFQEYYINDGLSEDSTAYAVRWLEANADKKFFCLLHYIHPHTPYTFRKGFDLGNGQSPPEYRFDYTDSQLKLLEIYDTEIAYTDSKIGIVLEKLRELSLLEKTLIVFTSDHGEEFYEHGGKLHGHSFYDELVRVPLIFHFPQALPGGKKIRQQVRLIDILPTTLDILGVDFDEDFALGKSLAPLLSENVEIDDLAAISEFLGKGNYDQKSIRYRGYKLIYEPETGRTELYDVSTDPGEMVDLSEAEPEIREDLLRRLRESIEENQSRFVIEAEPASPTQETKNALRALGYLD